METERVKEEARSAKDILLKVAGELGADKSLILDLLNSANEARRRIASVEYGRNYVKATFISSEASRKYPEKVVINRTLDGDLVKQKVGVPLEKAFHNAIVGEHGMKCTCEAALMTASRADRIIEHIAKKKGKKLSENYPFSKRVLCKHTLVLLDELLKRTSVDTRLIEKNLKIALAGYLLARRKADRKVINTALAEL